MRFTSGLKLSSWELKNGNARVETQLQVRSAWLRWTWKWAQCAWMHQLCKFLQCCRCLRMNGRWKGMIYGSIVLSSNSCKCNSSKSYAIQPIFSPKQVHHLSILSCKSHHESLSSCPPNLLSNFIHHQPRPKPISWTADKTRILTTDSDSAHQSPFRTPLLNQTLFSSLISFTVEQIRKVKPFLHCTALHHSTARRSAVCLCVHHLPRSKRRKRKNPLLRQDRKRHHIIWSLSGSLAASSWHCLKAMTTH